MYTKPVNLYARVSALQMSRTARRAAIANLRRSEVSVDLIMRAAVTFRCAVARLRRMFAPEARPATVKGAQESRQGSVDACCAKAGLVCS